MASIRITSGSRNDGRLAPNKKMMKKKKKKMTMMMKMPCFFSSIINKSSSSIWLNNKSNKNKSASSTSTYKRRKRNIVWRFNGGLKDMRKLSTNDEAFRISWETIGEIIDIIYSRKTPSRKTYRHWDEYAISFYLKMCTCFRVDFQHLEDGDNIGKKPVFYSKEDLTPYKHVGFDLKTPSLTNGMTHMERLKKVTGVGFVLRAQPLANETSYEERLERAKHMECSDMIQLPTKEMPYEEYVKKVLCNVPIGLKKRLIFEAAFDFGSYSSPTEPDRIPYHLYLLLKEAVAIIDNTNDPTDLKVVEEKICFFMTYFHSHLTPRFSYHRDKARSLIADYDSMRKPRYKMDSYTLYRFVGLVELGAWDPRTRESPQEMIDVMSIIHLRKTPVFWGMGLDMISFYCKLCSCFGIEYHQLEAASEDDVCLMNTRRNG